MSAETTPRRPPSEYRAKRLLDLAITVPLIVLLGPVAAFIAILIAIRQGRPVLFTQSRPGVKGDPFRMRKFRTMLDAYDDSGRPLPDAQRLTPLGRFLRATSLDELPELLSVLAGEMSLVGPRPLLMEYLPYFSEQEMDRFRVRPGLTGWAQVNGRNRLPWDRRLACDVWYVANCSCALDLRILWRTLADVLLRRHVEVDTAAEGNLAELRQGCEPGG